MMLTRTGLLSSRLVARPSSRVYHVCRAETSVVGVLETCGLKPYQMDRILKELERNSSANSPDWLDERVNLIKTALGSDTSVLADLIYNGGVELLTQDLNMYPEQLVKLKNVLNGAEVVTLVSKEPRLLWMSEIETKIPKVLDKLLKIWPYKGTAQKKQAEILQVVQEYPELLIRLIYFIDNPQIKTVQDLPVDLQNRILRSYC